MVTMWSKIHNNIRNDGRRGGVQKSFVSPMNSTKTNLGSAIFASPAINSKNEVVILTSKCLLYTVALNGAILWSANLAMLTTCKGSATLDIFDNIYVGTGDGVLFSYSPSGSFRWKYSHPFTSKVINSSPTILEDRLFVSYDDGNILTMNITTGKKISIKKFWFEYQSFVTSTISIDDQNNIYFVGTSFDLVVLFPNMTTKYLISEQSYTVGSPTIDNKRLSVLFSSHLGIYSYSFDGSLKWVNRLTSYSTPAIGNDGTIYLGFRAFGDSFGFCALNEKNGKILWSFNETKKNHYFDNAAAIDSDGTIYAGSTVLYAFTPKGSVKWTYDINGGNYATLSNYILLSSPAINSQGKVVIGSTNGYLYSVIQPQNSVIINNITNNVISTVDPGVVAAISVLVLVLSGVILLVLWPFRKYIYNYVIDSFNNNIVSFTKNKQESIPLYEKYVWDNLIFDYGAGEKGVIIGNGGFGIVIKAQLDASKVQLDLSSKTFSSQTSKENQVLLSSSPSSPTYNPCGCDVVAIKILVQANSQTSNDFEKIQLKTLEEVDTLAEIQSKLMNPDSIVNIYGIVSGILPPRLCALLHWPEGEYAFGMAMAFQRGGDLGKFLLRGSQLPFLEKIRILKDIAHCIAELHSVGFAHGDIKPANILLSDEKASKVCLADLGLSTHLKFSNIQASSLTQTKRTRGTPTYCAPEMLINPFDENFNEYVAKASRKTDMYAFAILCWQVLSSLTPFEDAINEVILSTKVHQGQRPSLDVLPSECSFNITSMIDSCWSSERANRMTATECWSLLTDEYTNLTEGTFEVFFYYSNTNSSLNQTSFLIFHYLSNLGVVVKSTTSNQELLDITADTKESNNSPVVLVFCETPPVDLNSFGAWTSKTKVYIVTNQKPTRSFRGFNMNIVSLPLLDSYYQPDVLEMDNKQSLIERCTEPWFRVLNKYLKPVTDSIHSRRQSSVI